MRIVYMPVWEMFTKLINYIVHHAIFAFQRNGCFLINICMRKIRCHIIRRVKIKRLLDRFRIYETGNLYFIKTISASDQPTT